MKIVCPGCAAEYNVDDQRIPPEGMKATCPKCMTSWVVQSGGAPEAPSTAGSDMDAAASGAMDFDPEPQAAPAAPVPRPAAAPPPPPAARTRLEGIEDLADEAEERVEAEPISFEIMGRSFELPPIPGLHHFKNLPLVITAVVGLLIALLLVIQLSRFGKDLSAKGRGWGQLDWAGIRLKDFWDADLPIKDAIDASGSYEQNLSDALNAYRRDTLPEYKKAEIFFRKAAKLKRSSAPPHAYLASIYARFLEYQQGSPAELKKQAQEHIHRAMRLEKVPNDSLRAQAEIQLVDKKYGEAQSSIQNALAANSAEGLNYLVQGHIHLATGAAELAQKAFEKAVMLNPQLTVAQYDMGIVLDRNAQYPEAEKSFLKALELSPGHPHSLLALAKLKLDRFNLIDDAVSLANQVLSTHKDKAASQDLAQANFLLARASERNGDLPKALSLIQEARKIDARNTALVIYEAEIRSRVEPTFKVEPFVDEWVKGDMQNADFFLYKARQASRAGKISDAIDLLNKVTNLDPSNARALYELGLNYERAQENDKALAAFEKSIRADRGFPDSYVRLASLQIDKNNLEAAVKMLEEVNRRNDRIASIRNLLGQIALRKGDSENARLEFSKALEIDPRFAPAHRSMTRYYMSKKDFSAAEKSAQQVRTLDPDSRDTQFLFGDLYLEEQRFADAYSAFEPAVKAEPKNVRALIGLGRAAMGQKNWAKAEECFNKVLEADETNSRAFYLLGQAYFADNRLDEAQQSFQSAQRFEPKNPEIFLRLGETNLAAGKFNEAISYLKDAIRLNPNYFEAYGQLAHAYLRLNSRKEAIATFEKQLSLTNDKVAQSDIYNAIGEIQKTDVPEEALDYFKKAYEANKKNAQAVVNIGMIQEENNNAAAAVKMYQLAISIDKKIAAPHRQLAYMYQAQNRNAQAIKEFEAYLRLAPSDAKDLAEIREQLSYLRGGR